MPLVPFVNVKADFGEKNIDIFSHLLNNRIIMLSGEITDATANLIVAEMLYLENQNPNKDIYIYINSPGGSVSAGMAIYDTMNHINCDVSTICIGIAASMAALLLAAGSKGKRFALPNIEVMIHQPLGGMHGQASDIKIHADHILDTRKKLNKILSDLTNQSFETIERDTDRDSFFSSFKAKEYGLIDNIIEGKYHE